MPSTTELYVVQVQFDGHTPVSSQWVFFDANAALDKYEVVINDPDVYGTVSILGPFTAGEDLLEDDGKVIRTHERWGTAR